MSDTLHHRGRSSRRTFMARSLALGISLAGVQAVLQACGGSQVSGATTGKGISLTGLKA